MKHRKSGLRRLEQAVEVGCQCRLCEYVSEIWTNMSGIIGDLNQL